MFDIEEERYDEKGLKWVGIESVEGKRNYLGICMSEKLIGIGGIPEHCYGNEDYNYGDDVHLVLFEKDLLGHPLCR